MSREDYKRSALYEVWQFITLRAQLKDREISRLKAADDLVGLAKSEANA